MSAKHTPGEWTLRQPSVNGVVQNHFLIESSEKRFPICRVQKETHSTDDPAQANARLIILSPVMLAELESWLKLFIEDDSEIGARVKATKAIIRKARGK